MTKKSGGFYAVRALEDLRSLFGGVCNWENCREMKDLQFAHRIKTNLFGKGRGSGERVRDIRKNPLSYILLCRTHHDKLDGRKLEELIK